MYRIVQTDRGYTAKPDSEADPEDFALPVAIPDEDTASEFVRMLNFRGGDRKFTRGMLKGVLLMNRDGVEYNPGPNPLDS